MSTGSPGGQVRTAEAILAVVAFYSFAGWVYIAANAVSHPETLRLPHTHLARWPHEDTFGAICLVISLASALAAAALRGRP